TDGAPHPPSGPPRATPPTPRAAKPDAAAPARGADRLRDPDHRPARLLDQELPGTRQDEDLQGLHDEDLRGRVVVAAGRQAAGRSPAGAWNEAPAAREPDRGARTPRAARRRPRPQHHAAGAASRRTPV